MLSCRELVRQSSEYVEGELTGWPKWSLKLHLLICHRCSRYVRHLRTTIDALAMLGRERAEPGREFMAGMKQKYREWAVASDHPGS